MGVGTALPATASGRLNRLSIRRAFAALTPLVWMVALPLAVLAGRQMAIEGRGRILVLGVAVLVAAAVLAPLIVSERTRRSALYVEVPAVLLILSTLILRVRGAEDLAGDPLDPAAQYRVICVALAGLLGGIALLSPAQGGTRTTTLPLRLYSLYVLVVFAGALLSVNVFLTAYRGMEVAAGLIVVAGAARQVGRGAADRLLTVLYWSTAALVGSVWLGVVLWPDAVNELRQGAIPIKWQLSGTFPALSANSVGIIGTILALWSLSLLFSSQEGIRLRRGAAVALSLVGLATLVGAQYRTGYVAFAVGLILLLILRGRKAAAGLAVVLVLAGVVGGSALSTTAEPYVLRGQTAEEAGELSGRLDWWSEALPVWRQSPIIGRGLLTATRFEVLATRGNERTSTIHGTWIEVLVGTGVVGVGLLAAAFLISIRRAFAYALVRGGRVVPAVLLVVVGIRSITASSFESFGYLCLLFLALALSLRDERVYSAGSAARGTHRPVANSTTPSEI